MTRAVHELDLPTLPVHDPAFAADPWPHFRAARDRHGWLAASDVGYLVHEYRAIHELYFMDDRLHFATRNLVDFMGAKGSPWGTFTEELMISQQGAEHHRLRATVAHAFGPGVVGRWRPLMRRTVAALLDEWAPRGAFDFAEFAANFPIRVMCGVIGAPPSVVPEIREYLEIQGLSFSMDPHFLPEADRAISALMAFVDKLVGERRRSAPRDPPDLLDELIAASSGGRLSHGELLNLLVFLFGAGYDTSKNVLTLTLHSMLERPAHWRRCAEDPQYCSLVMEEALRFHSVSNVPRTVVEAFDYRDVHFPVGTNLHFILTLSGRDPEAFEAPEEFCPGRERGNRHIAFGRGAHLCLGQFLARAQIEEGLHLMAQRIRSPRLAGAVTWRPFVGVWGIRSLPIAFDA